MFDENSLILFCIGCGVGSLITCCICKCFC